MAYTPENNPYIPGDPYSYDLKWQVDHINMLQGRVDDLDNAIQEATDEADRSEREADRSKEEADRATQQANMSADYSDYSYRQGLKSEGYATGQQNGENVNPGSPYYENNSKYFSQRSAASAQDAADYAAHISDPVSGIVTNWLADHITQPTTPAIDTSLTVAGAAADAKAVGDIILFNYPMALNFTSGQVFSINTHDFYTVANGSYAIVDLSGIENLVINYSRYYYPSVPAVVYFTGIPSTSTYLISENMPDQTTGAHDLNNFTCTIPNNATYAIIQGYTDVKYPEASKNSNLPEYIADINQKLTDITNTINAGVDYTITGNDVLLTSTCKDELLTIQIGQRGPNLIPDFRLISRGSELLYPGNTDTLCMPYQVAAVNNIDGDDPLTRTFTGGNHNYNNTGDLLSTATGRNILLKFYADGIEKSGNDAGKCNQFIIEVVNRIQAYNTRKSDGSGREVLEEHKVFIWDGKKLECFGETIPLEDVDIITYYGYAMSAALLPTIQYYGAANRNAFTYTDHIPSGNIKPNAIKLSSANSSIIMELNREWDLGADPMIAAPSSGAFSSGSKMYFYLIENQSFTSGAVTSSKATYKFDSVI